MNRRVFLLGLLAAGCTTGAPPGELAIAAGERGGMYFDFATLLAEQLVDVRGRALETEGSLANLALLAAGEAQVALALADSALVADPGLELRALGRVYENYLQLVVREGDPARTPAAKRTVHPPKGRARARGRRWLSQPPHCPPPAVPGSGTRRAVPPPRQKPQGQMVQPKRRRQAPLPRRRERLPARPS